MTGVSAAALRVGMRLGAITDLTRLPDGAIVIDNTEAPWTVQELFYNWEDKDERLFPMHLIYIPRDWEGPVEAPQIAVSGTESAGGQVVAGTGTPTQEGYRQMMRQQSMAAHPAGKGRGSLYLGDSGAAL